MLVLPRTFVMSTATVMLTTILLVRLAALRPIRCGVQSVGCLRPIYPTQKERASFHIHIVYDKYSP